MVSTNWPALGPANQMTKAKPPVKRTSGYSSHELSVSCACTHSTPSLDEKRATSPSSIDTSGACGRGSAMRARPISATSSPSPTWIDTTATPSTSAKLVNDTPAANQKLPRFMGK